jgi:predicted RNase H-like nuclease (RuvC/YqgF family)
MKNKNDIAQTVSSLRSKIEKLIQFHNRLKDDYSKLSVENETLIRKIEDQKNRINKLEDSNKVVKLAKALSADETRSAELKNKINELVREIDKSIALLNS